MMNYLKVVAISYLYPFFNIKSLQISDASGGNSYMKGHNIPQKDWYLKNGDVSCVNGFIKSQPISQCNESSFFNEIDEDVENCDVSGLHGSIKNHTLYQHNDLI